MIYELGDRKPQIHETVFIAQSADIIGSVIMEEDSSAWFGVVMRGDNDPITVGVGTNVQDGSVLHTDAGIPLTLGRDVTVGHKVMLHGCVIGDNTLVGINCVVLNRASIGKNCLIGANALITEGMSVPDGSMVLGSPGKIVRQISEQQIRVFRGMARHYVENARRYREQLRPG